MDVVRESWRRIECWMASEPALPPVEEIFSPPAPLAEIDAAERVLGHSFPTSYRASLLVHNGQIETGYVPHQYLDLVPGPAGDHGQVIYTRDECSFSSAGPDFADFLSRYADLIERGVARYDAETYAAVVPTDKQTAWEDLLCPPARLPT
jgi:cell wall assembly regulator SMI1